MKEVNFGFCENDTISRHMYDLIANNLLGVEQLNKVICRYEDMRNNFNRYPKDYAKSGREEWIFSDGLTPFTPKGRDDFYSDTTAVPITITHPEFLDLTTRKENRGAIGLDFPTWFYKTPEAPFIMIVAQDPLRSAKWYGNKNICNDAIVSSPFGLQDAHHREKGNGGKRIWLLVRALLKKGYNIYLTDCRKYFVYNHRESDAYSSPEKMKVYQNILNSEINIINPELIVTLGHRAVKCCHALLGDDDRLSGYIPHFCGTAGSKINDFFQVSGKTNVNELANLYADYIEGLVKIRKDG